MDASVLTLEHWQVRLQFLFYKPNLWEIVCIAIIRNSLLIGSCAQSCISIFIHSNNKSNTLSTIINKRWLLAGPRILCAWYRQRCICGLCRRLSYKIWRLQMYESLDSISIGLFFLEFHQHWHRVNDLPSRIVLDLVMTLAYFFAHQVFMHVLLSQKTRKVKKISLMRSKRITRLAFDFSIFYVLRLFTGRLGGYSSMGITFAARACAFCYCSLPSCVIPRSRMPSLVISVNCGIKRVMWEDMVSILSLNHSKFRWEQDAVKYSARCLFCKFWS